MPEVKRKLIYSTRKLVYKLPYDLRKKIRLRTLGGNEKTLEKFKLEWINSLVPSISARVSSFEIAVRMYAKVDIKVF